ncbi:MULTISPECIES: PKD-like family lipoprotein [unclassified Saccharicrinis]|uniref:PKD-like family lipoprotein n=1 Tax=unclassified Saccharicrinis TaxID=2646859 RepID=UPI003D32E5A1
MKIINRIVYSLLIGIFMVSCLKDNGEYDYIELEGVDFSNLPTEEYAIIGTELEIEGNIVTDIPEENRAYAWYIRVFRDGDRTGDTLSVEKDLNVITSFDPGTQNLIYSVYDKENNVRYNKAIDIYVVTPFTQGWAILKEKNGLAEFDFISEITDDLIVDVFENVAKVNPTGTPVNIGFNWNKAQGWNQMFICTSDGGAYFDGITMQLDKYIVDRFNSTSRLELPFTKIGIDNITDGYGWPLLAGGNIYTKNGSSLEDGWWEFPAEGDYYVTDKMAWGLGTVVYFDELNRRYITNAKNGYYTDYYKMEAVTTSDPENALFDPSNLNMDCMWMETEGSSYNIISVLKSDAGNYFLQRFLSHITKGFTANAHIQLPTGLVDDNSQYANDNVYSFTYMSQGNKIHRYNRVSDVINENYLELTGEIKKLEVHKEGGVLAVVYDSQDGGSTIEIIDLLNDGAVLATYEIDSKVVEIEHKLDD